MDRDNLLIVTSKWPGKTNSSDGGNSTVRELVDILSLDFNIDIMYFGNNGESSPRTGIRKVIKCEIDFDHYESYSSQADDKFTIRLKLSRIAAEYISRYEKDYKHNTVCGIAADLYVLADRLRHQACRCGRNGAERGSLPGYGGSGAEFRCQQRQLYYTRIHRPGGVGAGRAR